MPHRGNGQILSVTPNIATQNQTLYVDVVGQGTHWLQGATTADFGDPLTSTSYSLCVYDESAGVPTLVVAALAPAGGTCFNGQPCWKALGNRGFKYVDKDDTPHGLHKLVLLAGGQGHAYVFAKAHGPNLILPTLPLQQNPTVTVQVIHSGGGCWEGTFNAPAISSSGSQFRDSSD